VSEPTWRDVAALAAAGGIAVQPIGATEQHGPHLPLTTDALIATALAGAAVRRLAQRADAGEPEVPPVWLLPTLAYGKSPEHAGFAGTVTLSSRTILALCIDLARSVAAAGIDTLVFVNAHGGNPEALELVARDIRDDTGVFAVSVHAPSLPLPERLLAAMPRPELDVHAGFYETSLLLAIAPDSVHLELAAADGLERAAALDAASRSPLVGVFGGVPVPWRTSDVSASGTIGDPTGASAQWGSDALDAQGEALAEVLAGVARLRRQVP